MPEEHDISRIVAAMSGRRIAVIGDVMLDRYFRGTVTRISPEAPVPIVNVEDESEHPGGAANVAYNLATLGVKPLLLGVAGSDNAGTRLCALLDTLGIGGDGIVFAENRPTTVKGRVIAAGQHIVRIDREAAEDVEAEVLDRLLARLEDEVAGLDAIILQDYNKGVVTADLIAKSIAIANAHDVPVYVDPKYHNFFNYTDVSVFKPNRKEAEDALRHPLRTPEQRREGINTLLERLRCEYVVLTLSAEGILFAGRDEEPQLSPTRAMQVADVSGAGDTVIATLSAARAAGATMRQAVDIANLAAGIVCGKSGTVPIHSEDLMQ